MSKKAGREGNVVELAERLRAGSDARGCSGPQMAVTRVGRLVEWRDLQGPLVDYEGNPHGPLPARSVIPMTREYAATIVEDGLKLVLTFEQARPELPIILGVVQPPEMAASPTPVESESKGDGRGRPPLDVVVNGRRVRFEADEEIEFRCGDARIVLRRNGRVVVRGAYVETRSSGVNRIRGGSVRLN